MLNRFGETNDEIQQVAHSNAYQRGLAIAVILISVAALCAVLYLIPD